MSHKVAPDLLPAASDLLPVAEVIPLHRGQGGAPSQVRSSLRAGKAKARLTKTTLSKLVCPPGREDVIFWDDDVKGLGLRVYASGRRVWVVQYRDAQGRTRRTPIGKAEVVDPGAARRAAKDLLARVAGGANPSVERRAARGAARVAELIDSYCAHIEKELRPTSVTFKKLCLTRHAAPLHRESVDAVDRAMISRLHRRLGDEAGRVMANRVLASLSAMWTWGLRSGLVDGDRNPCAYVPKFSEQTRERVLSLDELRLIWLHTDGERTFDRITRLLMLTACRRQEIGGLRWSEVEGDLLIIPAARMKGKRAHEVPLAAMALAQLPPPEGDDGIFGAGVNGFDHWDGAKKQLDARIAKTRGAPLQHWGLHDLRRTFSTMMHERNLAEPHIIEAVLAHVQGGVAGIYNRAAYREQKRAALNAWAAIIENILGNS